MSPSTPSRYVAIVRSTRSKILSCVFGWEFIDHNSDRPRLELCYMYIHEVRIEAARARRAACRAIFRTVLILSSNARRKPRFHIMERFESSCFTEYLHDWRMIEDAGGPVRCVYNF